MRYDSRGRSTVLQFHSIGNGITSRTACVKPSAPLEPEVIDKRRAQSPPADLEQLKFLATLMDSVFEIPGIRLRFGLDAILGLLPGLGDFTTSFVTLYILQEAHRRGVSRITLARMGFNILIDWLVGTVPLVGDLFDIGWKSNNKNVALLLEHAAAGEQKRIAGDWIFLWSIIVGLLLVLAGSLTLSYFLVSSVVRWLWSA